MKMVTEFMVSLAIWLFGAYRWIFKKSAALLLGFCSLRLAECALIGNRIGVKYGLPRWLNDPLCVLFGAAWWYPLKRRMSYDAQTDKYWDIPAEFRGSKEDWIFVPNK